MTLYKIQLSQRLYEVFALVKLLVSYDKLNFRICGRCTIMVFFELSHIKLCRNQVAQSPRKASPEKRGSLPSFDWEERFSYLHI